MLASTAALILIGPQAVVSDLHFRTHLGSALAVPHSFEACVGRGNVSEVGGEHESRVRLIGDRHLEPEDITALERDGFHSIRNVGEWNLVELRFLDAVQGGTDRPESFLPGL